MNSSLQRIKAWRSRRQLRSLAEWEQIRAKGKARFVFQSALTFSLVMVGVRDVSDHVFGGVQHPISLSWIIWYFLFGVIGGFTGWNTMEGKYKNALIDARINASPSSTLPNR